MSHNLAELKKEIKSGIKSRIGNRKENWYCWKLSKGYDDRLLKVEQSEMGMKGDETNA